MGRRGFLRTAGLRALARGMAVCTVYYPNYPDATQQRASVAGSTLFNDVILREAFAAGLPVLDLRQVVIAGEDYANASEPSSAGGQHDFQRGRSEVFVGA